MTEVHSTVMHSYSPADLGSLLLQKLERENGFDEQKAGDIVEIDGVSHVLTPVMRHERDPITGEWKEVPYTYRGYYSHHDPDTYEPGPGWDSRWSLADDAIAMASHGRTFTLRQVQRPAVYMPQTPVYMARPIDGEQPLA